MKTVSKKLLSLLLVVLLLAAAVPFQAFAEGTPYTVRVVAKNPDGTKIDHYDIPVTTENPVTKSQIDAAVAIIAPGMKITGYGTATAASITLTNLNDTVAVDDLSKLENGRFKVFVYVESNDPPAAPAGSITLTLDAGSGTIGSSGSTTTITITEKDSAGKYVVPTLPTASRSGYTFKGWFLADGTRVENGSKLEAPATATAQYEQITYNLKVKGMKTTQSAENAWLITEYNATPNQNLLGFLRNHATTAVQDATPTGYKLKKSGDAIVWYNYNGSTTLSDQLQITSAAQEVLVKYEPKTFTLYFQVDGGQVDPTSKTVTYDSKVGTLPTPTKSGKVFLGWFDEDGVQYTSETVYKVNGNTTLTARWQNESSVLLRIYLSPNTTTPDRIVDITGKVVGNSVGRTEVESVVTKYYTGSNMKLIGLFSDATWASYKAGSITEGTPNVTIQEDVKTTNVHVVVTGATNKPNSNNNGSSSTTATTKPADSDNPKTGDSMMIYAASAVMVLAAAALVTIQVLRKKRTY